MYRLHTCSTATPEPRSRGEAGAVALRLVLFYSRNEVLEQRICTALWHLAPRLVRSSDRGLDDPAILSDCLGRLSFRVDGLFHLEYKLIRPFSARPEGDAVILATGDGCE